MTSLLSLLQLASSTLPVGAYSYSEGLETLVDKGIIHDAVTLQHWLEKELHYGAIRLETAVMLRAHDSFAQKDWQTLTSWNDWLAATRETFELRQQSWQMGQSLLRLLQTLQPAIPNLPITQCHYAIAYGIAVYHWQIDPQPATIAYLHSWATNLVNAGVKLIPLGQTAGQQLLLDLKETIEAVSEVILTQDDDDLESCSWGLALASMAHEVQYSRLFRS
jgi:urease accessory protein